MNLNFYKQLSQKQYQYFLFLILAIYIVGYWMFLHASEYLPYVLDNNETYSSLVHAYNMYFGDWSQSFGLTDEAFSPDPAAHPMIHTHQGNWPRILSYIFFAFGARNPETQIILHVFLIGSISIWLMYRYFALIANNMIAFAVCLMFITDYMLFAQWQVVTYRIWHAYFIFACLNCMHEINKKNIKWNIFFVFNFAALFYWELVFAFFTSAWCFLYYVIAINHDFRKIYKTFLKIGFSGMIGLSLLFSQLSLFIGFKNAIMDYYLTFFARNFAVDQDSFKQTLDSFYADKDIAFFYNIVNGDSYRTPLRFIRSIFEYGFQIHTPIFGLLVLLVSMSIFLKLVKNKLKSNYAWQEIHVTTAFRISSILLTLLIFTLFIDNAFLGVRDNSVYYNYGSLIQMATSIFLGYPLSYMIYNVNISISKTISVIDVLIINVYFATGICAIFILPFLFQSSYDVIWFSTLSKDFYVTTWRLFLLAIILVTSSNILDNSNPKKSKLVGIWKYVFAGILAYICVYILSPGYIFSGYLVRSAPFIVFFVDATIGICFLYLISEFINKLFYIKLLYNLLRPSTWSIWQNNFRFALPVMVNLFGYTLIIGMFVIHWIYLQINYSKLFPADSMIFVKKFRENDYHQNTIATNQYSLPFAYEAKSWAYSALNLGAGDLVLTDHGYNISSKDYEYLWYKNKKKYNYSTPDLFVCFMPNSMDGVANELRHANSIENTCLANRVVMHSILQKSSDNQIFKLKHEIVEVDTDHKIKWAIVKYDWNFPPYFVKDTNAKYFDVNFDKAKKKLKVKYLYKQDGNIEEKDSKFQIFAVRGKDKYDLLASAVANNGILEISLPESKFQTLKIQAIPNSLHKTGKIITEFAKVEN